MYGLEIVNGFRTIGAEQPRHRSVSQQPSSRLAPRTVVALVVGVPDPLHGRGTHGARLPKPTVNGHPLTKRGDLLRKPAIQLAGQSVYPAPKRRRRGQIQAFSLFLRE